jgi:UDP-3-O-[3-hydroxymyristoyl] N-acetylglucosamine deacetylase / 3-hydroxyacyl-[acyl-carrier-protein] dehydratase
MRPPALQRTLERPAVLHGVGLHTGRTATLTFRPADPDTGYVIVRSDLPGAPRIHPGPDRVTHTQRGTTLAENGVEVNTVEHVLAALFGLQIDNCIIELTGPEPPILDGSALGFVEALRAAGTREQPEAPRRPYRLDRVVTVQDGDKSIVGWPHAGLRVTYELDFPRTWVAPQRVTLDLTPEVFVAEIARCRTFCFEQEINWLQEKGLARGGTLENAIVLGDTGVLNGPLRSEQELALHKVLDFLGDLALLGRPVEGHFVATKSGHALNSELTTLLRETLTRQEQAQGGTSQVIIQASEIMNFLPHRYPFLLVDRILDLEPGKRVVGIKNVTINEPFFQGHFPSHPIMPGVLIVEAMAQVGGVLLMQTVKDPGSKVVYFITLDNVKFRKPVLPGDQLRFVLTVVKIKERIAVMHGEAFVGEDLVCEGDMKSTIVDR